MDYEWALKENQIFGKKGGTHIPKEIVTLLQGFFQAGNANKSGHYSAEDMYAELNDMVSKEEISADSIPKVKTIHGWITRYAAACKAEMAKIVLNR